MNGNEVDAVGPEPGATMFAVVCSGIQKWTYVEDYPVPVLVPTLSLKIEPTCKLCVQGKGEVLARVLGVGICASDVKMYDGAEFYFGPNGRVRSLPVIPGHEFVARVVSFERSHFSYKHE